MEVQVLSSAQSKKQNPIFMGFCFLLCREETRQFLVSCEDLKGAGIIRVKTSIAEPGSRVLSIFKSENTRIRLWLLRSKTT